MAKQPTRRTLYSGGVPIEPPRQHHDHDHDHHHHDHENDQYEAPITYEGEPDLKGRSEPNGCPHPPCPKPVVNIAKRCGEYHFFGNSVLHYDTPAGDYTVYEKINNNWCPIGGVPIGNSRCDTGLEFPSLRPYMIEWCVPVTEHDPIFSTLALEGSSAYAASATGESSPDFDWFNSFAIAVPECCSIVVVLDDTTEIPLPVMNKPYTIAYGPFDTYYKKVELRGRKECVENTTMAVQRSRYGTPTISPIDSVTADGCCGNRHDHDHDHDHDHHDHDHHHHHEEEERYERVEACIKYRGKTYAGFRINRVTDKETTLVRYEWHDYQRIDDDLVIDVSYNCTCPLLFINPVTKP